MFNLMFSAPSVEEEFDHLWQVLGEYADLKKEGYYVQLPDHPGFNQLIQDLSGLEKKKGKLKEVFEKEIFNQDFYTSALKDLEGRRGFIEQCFPYFEKLQKDWNFKVYPEYKIVLTRYGTGGSYDPEQGLIILRINNNGALEEAEKTIIHEMVHLGIEENIIKHRNLSHEEKESLVDQICSVELQELLTNYQNQGYENISDIKLNKDT